MKNVRFFALLVCAGVLASCNGNDSAKYSFSEGTISISEEAKEFIRLRGGDLDRDELGEEIFEGVGRKATMNQDPSLPLPTTDPLGNPLVYGNQLVEQQYAEGRVYSFVPEDGYDKIVLYLHGGAYAYDFSYAHLRFCDSLATKVHAKVVVPQYPLSFMSTFETAYRMVSSVYADLVEEGKSITIGGDSAGGGFSLGFTQYLRKNGRKLPDKMFLLSPWLDITMTNPDIPAYQQKDISLMTYGAVELGKIWAGATDRNNYRLSPINGDMTGLPSTMIMVGDCEIVYPDCRKLGEMLRGKTDVKFITGIGLFHVFPVYMFLPEAVEALGVIADFIKE